MRYTTLGKSSLYISSIVFGGNVFGWTLDKKLSFRMLDGATDRGINMIDTANSYSHWAPGNKGGESETIIGKWLQQNGGRGKVILATKVGSSMGTGKNDLSKDHIIQEAEASLRRLHTDYIDLYQTHHDDPETAPAEVLEAYSQLIKDGKVRYIGASNVSKERFQITQEESNRRNLPSYQSLQPLYNLYQRSDFEKEWESYIKNSDLGVLTYYSLASGFLSGKYRSDADLNKSKRGFGMKQYLNDRGFRILDALDTVSKDYHTAPATVALAWLLSKPIVTAAIASATNEKQLESLLEAGDLSLDKSSLEKLNRASSY